MDLDDDLWVPFVCDTVYTMMNKYRQRRRTPTSSMVIYRTVTYLYLKFGIVKSTLNTTNLAIDFALFPKIKMRTLQVLTLKT